MTKDRPRVRIPEALYREVKIKAATEGNTYTAQVIKLIEKGLGK